MRYGHEEEAVKQIFDERKVLWVSLWLKIGVALIVRTTNYNRTKYMELMATKIDNDRGYVEARKRQENSLELVPVEGELSNTIYAQARRDRKTVRMRCQQKRRLSSAPDLRMYNSTTRRIRHHESDEFESLLEHYRREEDAADRKRALLAQKNLSDSPFDSEKSEPEDL